MDILKNNRGNTDFSHLGVLSLNTTGYGDVSKTSLKAALENGAAELVSKQLDEVDYDLLALETNKARGMQEDTNWFDWSPVGMAYNVATNASDIWKQANVQGHSVNLSKKQDELLNTEGSWVPQIDLAAQYLSNKKRIELLVGTPTTDEQQTAELLLEVNSLLALNSQLEPAVRAAARTNPYLLDIFYETNAGKMFLTDAFSPLDVLKVATRDIADELVLSDWNPSNNLKHMLEKDVTLIPGTATHLLSKQLLDAMWNVKNNTGSKYSLDSLIEKLNEFKEYADIRYQAKTDDIIDKVNTIKKGNSLFDPTKIDPDFVKNFENNEISAKDPKTWIYALPHLGSSYSELGAMVGQIGASAVLNGVAKGALTTATGGTLPLLFAATEATANLAIAQYMRESETKSEAFDAYNSRITSELDNAKIDVNRILEEVIPLLDALGYNVEEMKDHEIFSAMIALNIRTNDLTFNAILDESKKGLDAVRNTNEALSFGDYALSMLFSYGGKYLSKAYGTSRLAKSSAGMADKNMLASNVAKSIELDPSMLAGTPLFSTASKLLDRTIVRAATKAAGNLITGNAVKRVANGISTLGKAAGISYFTERTEEGQQYIVSKRYQDGIYDNVKDYNIVDGIANALNLGVEANAAYYGLHPDSSLNTDKELINSMEIGGFTGLFMSGVYGSRDIINTTKQAVADIKLRGLVADNYAEAEKDTKIDLFLKLGRKESNFNSVYTTLQDLKQNKPEGVTDEMIDEDIDLAKKVYAYSGSKQTKKNLKVAGIDPNSEDFNKFVLNAVHLEERYQAQSTAAENSNKKLELLLLTILNDFLAGSENKLIQDWLSDLYNAYSNGKNLEEVVSRDEFSRQVFGQVASSIENRAIETLSSELEARENDLKKLVDELKIDVNVKGISSIRKYVDRLKKASGLRVETLVKNARAAGMSGTDIEVLKQIADNTPAIELESLLVSSIAEAVINTGALLDLQEHRKAYLTGKYAGEVDAYMPTWNNITESQREDVINQKTKSAQDQGREIPTLNEIKKLYNDTVKNAYVEQEEFANQEGVQLSRAAAVFRHDLKNRVEFEKVAIAEKEEQFSSPVDTEKVTAEEKPIDKVDEETNLTDKVEVAEDPNLPKDELVEAARPATLQDKIEVVSPVLEALNRLDEELNPDIIVIPEDALTEEEADKFTVVDDQDDLKLQESIANLNAAFDEKTALEALLNRAELQEEEDSHSAVEELSEKIENGDKIEAVSEDKEEGIEEVPEKKEDSVEEVAPKKEGEIKPEKPTIEIPLAEPEKPIEISDLTGAQLDEIPANLLEADASELFIDPSTEQLMWDPSGNQDMGNAMQLDATALLQQLLFEDEYGDNPFVSPMSSQNLSKEINSTPGLADKDKLKKNRIKNTFFYQPTATDVMPITVAGKPLQITTIDGKPANRRPGKELAVNLEIPGWLETADDVYYVVTSSTHTTSNPIDDLAVHMLIEKDGKVYNTSLRAINDNLRDDLKYLGLTKEEVDSEIAQLRQLRQSIIRAYSQEYARTGMLPLQALKHVKAKNLRISNGTLNNLKRAVSMDQSVPIYRSLTEVEDLGVSSDPLEMSRQILDGDVEIGYGTGPFALMSEPFTIMGLVDRAPTETQGTGYAGKLYIIPKPSLTPSQRVTLPIMLAEELHTIPAETADLVKLAYDEKGNRLFNEDGTPVPMSTAEYIYELLKNPALLGDATPAFLDLLCHNGSRTLTTDFNEQDSANFHFLVRKQLHAFTNKKGDRVLITAGRRLENDPSRGYNPRFTNLSHVTVAQKRQVILDISRNIHWNTDKDVLTAPLDPTIVGHVIKLAEKNSLNSASHRYPLGSTDLTFSLEDVGYTKIGTKVVKRVDGADAPLALTWFINLKKIKTDLGDRIFRAPFVYADDIAIKEVLKPAVKTELKVITTSLEVIADAATAQASKPREVRMAEPATPENLAKYGLTIPEDQHLLKGRVWGIAEIRGKYKVLLAPKDKVSGVYSIVLGQGTMNFTEAKQWIIDTLGIDPDNVMAVNAAMKMNGDMEVYGVMNVAVDTMHNTFSPRITLSTVAGKGIEYHEAFHYVSLLLLEHNERQTLYLDYINRNPKAKDFTKELVEEALAEEFRSWMLKEKNPTLGYKVSKFFRQLKHFVDRLRGKGLNYTMFKAIKDGKFKNAEVDLDTLKEFKQSYEKGVFYYIPGVTPDELAKIPHITDSNTFYRIIDSLTSTALAVYGIKSYEDVKALRVDSVFDQIQENLEMGWIDEANVPLTEDVLANFDIFRRKILDRLNELSIKEVNKLEYDEAKKLALETGEEMDNIWDKNQGEISKKANVSFSAKLFFYSIPKTEYKFVKDEATGLITKELDEIKDPIFGLPVTETFDVVWTQVMEHLWSVETYEDIVSESKRLGEALPFFKVLHDQLTSVESPISVNTLTQLLNTIKSSKNSMTTIKIHPDLPNIDYNTKPSDEEIADEVAAALKRSVWDVKDSDSLRKIARYPKQWSNAFYTSDNVVVNSDGTRSVSELGFGYMSAKRRAINATIKQIQRKDKKKPVDLEVSLLILKDRFVELCNGLKIPFDHVSLDYMLNLYENSNIIKDASELNRFISMWLARGTSFDSMLGEIASIYTAQQTGITRKNKKLRSLDKIFTTKKDNAQISVMAVAYGTTHPSPEEFSVTGADNSLIYPISENNYMSDLIRWFNKNLNDKKKNIINTPYSKRSLLANSENKLKLHTLLAIDDQLSGTSRDYFGISPLEDYIAKLVLTFNDHLTLPTMSDKKTWYSISGIKLAKNVLDRYKADVNFEALGIAGLAANKLIRFDESTIGIISNYFLDELDAIIDYYKHKEYVAAHPEERTDNYHGKIKDGEMQSGGNGGRFRYFNQLAINGKTVYLNKDLSAVEKSGSTADVLKHLKDVQALFTEEILANSVNTLLLEKTDLEMKNLEKLGVIQNANGQYINKLIPHNVMLKYKELFANVPYKSELERNHDIIRSIIGTHVANTFISIEELEKCFVGDPAYYKWKLHEESETADSITTTYDVITGRDVDKIKRLSSVLSTGTNLRTYWGPGQDAKNNTKFTVMNLADNNVTSTYHGFLLDTFKNSLIRDMISSNNPNLDDNQILKLVDTPEKQQAEYDKLTKVQQEFVDAQSVNSAKPYDEERINQADAAVYIRPAMYRRIIEALGEWSPEVEAAFNMMESEDSEWLDDSTKYAVAMKTLIKPLKMMYFGDHRNDKLNLNIPVFDKMAIFPMFRVLANADNKVLYDRMNNAELGEIDMIAFESAIKVGGREKIKMYKDEFNEEFDSEILNRLSYAKTGKVGDLPTYTLDLTQLRLQLNTDPHEHKERSFGTQAVKICLGNTVDERLYGENKGRSVDGKTIKIGVMDAIKALSTKGRNAVMGKFFTDGQIDNEKLSKFLVDEARGSGLSDEFIFGLTLNERGLFRMPLAAMSSRNWVESRIISVVNKETIDVNTPGGSAVQMSSFGFKATGIRKESAATKAFNGGKKLNFINKDGSIDIMLSTNFFRHVVPEEHLVSYAAMRKWLLDNNVIGENAKPFGIGYRIPTQGLSSTFAFKVMDVLPSIMADTMVVPDEFTGQTGSDFDVDKVYLATNAYEDGKYVEMAKDEDGVELPDIMQSKEALINRMLDYYTLVVSDNKNMAETRASIDTLTKILLKDILPLVETKSEDEAVPFYELIPSFLLSRKEEYTGGKAGIAPFALNSTNHCLTQLVHLQMNYSNGNKYGLGLIDDIKGQDGFRILDWLSAMINAHVDVAKDPYIMTLNVNAITYNMTNLLLRGGKGKSTFYFLAQPILKEYTAKKIAERGIYGVEELKFDNQLIGEMLSAYEGILKEQILKMDPSTKEAKDATAMFNGWVQDRASEDKGAATKISTIVESIMPNKALALDEKSLIKSLKEAKLLSTAHLFQQLLALKAYSELSDDAKTLSELVHRSQIDTKKFGNNLADQMNFKNSYNTFIEENGTKFAIKGVPFNENNPKLALETYFNDTFLAKKLYYGTTLPRKILKSLTFSATRLYESIFTSVMGTFGAKSYYSDRNGMEIPAYKHVGDKKKVKAIHLYTESIVRSRITRQSPSFRIDDTVFADMFYGRNTMCKRLSGIKLYLVLNKDNFPYLVGQDGVIKNDLLNYLQEFSGNGTTLKADRILLFNSSMNNSASTENRLVSAFSDLLESHDEHIRKFANDLAFYSYYTSYDNRGVNSFFHLVPVWWKDLNGYISTIKDALDSFNYDIDNGISAISEASDAHGDYPSLYVTMARNLWRDDEMVPKHDLDKKAGDKIIYAVTSLIGTGLYNIPTLFASRIDESFMKMLIGKDSENTNLYRKIAEVYYENAEGKQLSKRYIYQVAPKLGFNDNGYQIYEFLKDSMEVSAFDNNSLPEGADIDTSLIEKDVIDKTLPKLKKNADAFTAVFNLFNADLILAKIKKDDAIINTENSIVEAGDTSVSDVESYGDTTDVDTTEMNLGSEQLDMFDFDDSALAAFEQELSSELFTLGNSMEEAESFGSEFAAMDESSPEVAESNAETFEDTESLSLLGQQRKKECE